MLQQLLWRLMAPRKSAICWLTWQAPEAASLEIQMDYRMPCTAAEDTTCQIVTSLSLWNEFLCFLGLELRELPRTGRQLGLVCVRNACLPVPTEGRLRQAAAVLYWLLKAHRCVASVHVPQDIDSAEISKLCRAVLCDVLEGNSSVKSLALERSSLVQNEIFGKVLSSLICLEELECSAFSYGSAFPTAVSTLLQTTATLTVLNFTMKHIGATQAQLFLTALKANNSLRELTLDSSTILADPASFVEFLTSSAALQRLSVVGSDYFGDDTLKWVFEGMLKNGTVCSLEADDLTLDAESVELAARMLAGNKVLRRFKVCRLLSLSESPLVRKLALSTVSLNTVSWQKAISQNNTLQYMTLSFNIWNTEYWEPFFRVLSQHKSLEMVTILVREDECGRFPGIMRELKRSGCEEKVSFKAPCSADTFPFPDCKDCSELRAPVGVQTKPRMLPVFQQLSTFSHLKILSLTIVEWEREVCSLLVEYISTTHTLQQLDIQLRPIDFPPESADWWPAISQSFLHNKSIIELGIGVYVDSCEDLECLGDAVIRSSTIRKIRLLKWFSSARLSFLRGLQTGISKNRALCSATLDSEPSSGPWAAVWFAVCDTARRNSGCVARAAQFLSHARCDTLCAAALDRVSRHPAPVAELAEVLSIDKVEAVDMVRQKFRCIEGLHDFMRLAGVVKEQVTCMPRQDGRTQLDGLNQACWSHVRRYLELDDVEYGTATRR
ncbi:hypothetical protein HPB49_024566 [Dermacentor silvarum]|uniref:Uncharacterized protein n=1 Tax=Dermacentor silvarum TaxID=543639 RepID=A0ACB8CTZ1_DERSI|nr:hypothetical protein HPB49_024566 [Dermacentor silvarum]